jgi:prophage regulatory protein
MSPTPQPDPFAGFPDSGFVREKTILKYLPVNRATLWRWVAAGTFPQPQKIGENVTVWNARAVREHLAPSSICFPLPRC